MGHFKVGVRLGRCGVACHCGTILVDLPRRRLEAVDARKNGAREGALPFFLAPKYFPAPATQAIVWPIFPQHLAKASKRDHSVSKKVAYLVHSVQKTNLKISNYSVGS